MGVRALVMLRERSGARAKVRGGAFPRILALLVKGSLTSSTSAVDRRLPGRIDGKPPPLR